MTRLIVLLIGVAVALGAVASRSAPDTQPASPSTRFLAVDVFIDSADKPLAAYQFELVCKGDVQLVGLEGGEHPAFKAAPYYDPLANLNRRIVIAAFNTGAALPHGRTRVARLMVASPGEVEFSANLQTAADAEGKVIPATVSADKPTQPSDGGESRDAQAKEFHP